MVESESMSLTTVLQHLVSSGAGMHIHLSLISVQTLQKIKLYSISQLWKSIYTMKASTQRSGKTINIDDIFLEQFYR